MSLPELPVVPVAGESLGDRVVSLSRLPGAVGAVEFPDERWSLVSPGMAGDVGGAVVGSAALGSELEGV